MYNIYQCVHYVYQVIFNFRQVMFNLRKAIFNFYQLMFNFYQVVINNYIFSTIIYTFIIYIYTLIIYINIFKIIIYQSVCKKEPCKMQSIPFKLNLSCFLLRWHNNVQQNPNACRFPQSFYNAKMSIQYYFMETIIIHFSLTKVKR